MFRHVICNYQSYGLFFEYKKSISQRAINYNLFKKKLGWSHNTHGDTCLACCHRIPEHCIGFLEFCFEWTLSRVRSKGHYPPEKKVTHLFFFKSNPHVSLDQWSSSWPRILRTVLFQTHPSFGTTLGWRMPWPQLGLPVKGTLMLQLALVQLL